MRLRLWVIQRAATISGAPQGVTARKPVARKKTCRLAVQRRIKALLKLAAEVGMPRARCANCSDQSGFNGNRTRVEIVRLGLMVGIVKLGNRAIRELNQFGRSG